ncbi:MAG: S41 family peptidase [Algoriphagus sp.]|jgi:hypothetical protein|nr:S41 family peptidase [Algoriphagus sp.]
MRKFLFTILGIILKAYPIFSQMLSPEQVQADLKIFRESLEVFHPELYRYQTREDFLQQLNALESSMNLPLSHREFYQKMLPIIGNIKDGHLKWIVQGKDQYYPFFEDQLFPVQVHVDKEQVLVMRNLGKETLPKLAKITAINGQPIQQIVTALMANSTFGDGESEGGKYFQLNKYFSALYANQFGVSETYSIGVEVDGKHSIVEVEGVNKDQIESAFPSIQAPFSFEIKEKKIAVITIHRFFTYPGEADFKRFLKESFSKIQAQGIQKLILDLRGNEGGNEKWGIELYRYLAKTPFYYYEKVTSRPNQKLAFETHTSRLFKLANSFSKKESDEFLFRFAPHGLTKPYSSAFQGELVVLLDGQSFSVTTEFASRVKADGRAKFIGEETAGGAALNSSGFFTIVTLPNSKIDLGIPRLGFHMANLPKSMDARRGILPDLKAGLSAEEKLSGKDSVMQLAIDLMR